MPILKLSGFLRFGKHLRFCTKAFSKSQPRYVFRALSANNSRLSGLSCNALFMSSIAPLYCTDFALAIDLPIKALLSWGYFARAASKNFRAAIFRRVIKMRSCQVMLFHPTSFVLLFSRHEVSQFPVQRLVAINFIFLLTSLHCYGKLFKNTI